MKNKKEKKPFFTARKTKLIIYDTLLIMLSVFVVYGIQLNIENFITFKDIVIHFLLVTISLITARSIGKIYAQVWRFSCTYSYLRLIYSDFFGSIIYFILEKIIPVVKMSFISKLTVIMFSLLGAMFLRFIYTRIFELSSTSIVLKKIFGKNTGFARALNKIMYFLTGVNFTKETLSNKIPVANKIRIAIVGAGRIGAMLAEDLQKNKNSVYNPVFFIDTDQSKIGREVMGIRVIPDNKELKQTLDNLSVQEVVFAVTMDADTRKELYKKYNDMGFKVKVYTFPMENSAESGKRQIRAFDPEELLFRQEVNFLDDNTKAFYSGKIVLVTGGGGSIGSEIARQIAKMHPKQLILLDIYENNLYDVQQELLLTYGNKLNLQIEIASIRDIGQIDKIFSQYKPQIVLHAAAHKHVPLMEHNCSEAVKNNIFGTKNMIEISEKYKVEKFIMISTDKAVNPTNVMGASKRFCEMMVLSRAGEQSKTSFSCTRFGNVLGSNGSVIPLFKRQIANGGPITVTDKRIIRYFMTIPEASQLVLTSGAMAKSGELFVLDMGRPVKILDLAENMILLSGMKPYEDIDIVEVGLRPGEKLYEELLIKTETLSKTENSKIFIEKDDPLSTGEIEEKLKILSNSLETKDDEKIKNALKEVVPTFKSPESVNDAAIEKNKFFA